MKTEQQIRALFTSATNYLASNPLFRKPDLDTKTAIDFAACAATLKILLWILDLPFPTQPPPTNPPSPNHHIPPSN